MCLYKLFKVIDNNKCTSLLRYLTLLVQLIIGFFSFFLLQPFTVLMKQTRQAVCAIKQSIFLDVYGLTLDRDGEKKGNVVFYSRDETT